MLNDYCVNDPLTPLVRAEAEHMVEQIVCPCTNAVEFYVPYFEPMLVNLGMALVTKRYVLVDAFLRVCDERALSGAAAYEILKQTQPCKAHLPNWERCNEKWHRLYVQNIQACKNISEMLDVARSQGRML